MRSALICILGMSLPAQGQLLYANGFFDPAAGGRVIYHVDVTSGQTTPWTVIKKPGLKEITSMEVVRNSLYVSSGRLIVKINMNTKHMRVIGRTGEQLWGGMAWDGETMWATKNGSSLYTLDLNTADATFVKGITGRHSGLTFNKLDGRIYTASDTSQPQGHGIYSFNPKNLNALPVKLTGFPLGDTDVDSIAFDGVSKYYLVNEYNSTNPGTKVDGIYVYDTITKSYSFMNTIYPAGTQPGQTTLSGATFIPAPGTLGLLALFGLGAARRTR